MRQDELQIGDLVQSFPDTGKIDGIVCLREEHTAEEKWFAVVHLGGNRYERVNVGMLNPIPLTGEILKKNGFKHLQDTYLFNIGINQFGIDLWIEIGPDSWIENNKIYIDSLKEIDDTMISVTTCKYVHELQHLLKLLKIRKDIVL